MYFEAYFFVILDYDHHALNHVIPSLMSSKGTFILGDLLLLSYCYIFFFISLQMTFC